jgi:RecA-family ATPase
MMMPGMDFVDCEAEEPPKPNGQDSSPALAAIDPTALHGLPIPPRHWLVPDWIPMARATSLYGGGGEGKTLIAQMLATACAIGGKWLSMSVRKHNSVLLFCEDDLDEMHRRQADINAFYECSFADLGAMRWLPRLGADNSLMVFENGRARHTDLFEQLLSAAKTHQAGLVITDTLADVFGGNENDRVQARQFAQAALGHIARITGAASLTLAHPSLTGSANGSTGSGSTGWKGTFRSQLYLESPKAEEGEPLDPDIRLLRRAKANFARRDETIELRWKAGVFVPLHASTGIVGWIERRTTEHVFCALLEQTYSKGQYVSHNSRAGNYAPKIFALRPDREHFRKADFEHVMHALLSRGEISIEPYKDAYGHTHERLTKCNGSATL